MSWLGYRDFRAPAGAQVLAGLAKYKSGELITAGSLRFEFDFSNRANRPCRLFQYIGTNGWLRRMTIFLNPDFSLSMEIQQGPSRAYTLVNGLRELPKGAVRMTYSWDGPAMRGLFTIEDLDGGSIIQTKVKAPPPLPIDDLARILCRDQTVLADDRLTAVALGTGRAPVGPLATIGMGTLVDTPDGPRPIERLRPGDTVLTDAHKHRPIRWILRQKLPATGLHTPIRLRAPFFGLKHDIVVAREQKIELKGLDAERMFGRYSILVRAGDLAGRPGISSVERSTHMTYYQILLDEPECLHLSGGRGESLFIGALAKSPEILATTGLCALTPAALPVHTRKGTMDEQKDEYGSHLRAISA